MLNSPPLRQGALALWIVRNKPISYACRFIYTCCDLLSTPDLYEAIRDDGQNAIHLDTQGPCTVSQAYFTRDASTSVAFAEITNDLSGEYCIAFVAEANVANTQPLLRISDVLDTTELASITVSGTTVTYTVRGSTINFPVTSTVDFQHFQLCSNGSAVTLYDDCSAPQTQDFIHRGFHEIDIIHLLAEADGTNGFQVRLSSCEPHTQFKDIYYFCP